MNGLFFHIAKAAGTSQVNIINKYDHLQCYNSDGYPDHGDRIKFDNYFGWTVIRNPFDRLASVLGAWRWKNVHKEMNDLLDLVELGSQLNWKLSDMFNVVSQDVQKSDLWQKTDMAILCHLVPMNLYVQTWEKTINRKIDFIGRFENLTEDWKFIREKVCITDRLRILNKSEHKPYQKYFNRKRIADRAIQLYEEDFDNFKYHKGIVK
jgi:hypothetical protein